MTDKKEKINLKDFASLINAKCAAKKAANKANSNQSK